MKIDVRLHLVITHALLLTWHVHHALVEVKLCVHFKEQAKLYGLMRSACNVDKIIAATENYRSVGE